MLNKRQLESLSLPWPFWPFLLAALEITTLICQKQTLVAMQHHAIWAHCGHPTSFLRLFDDFGAADVRFADFPAVHCNCANGCFLRVHNDRS